MTNNRMPQNRYWGDKQPPKSKVDFFSAVAFPAAEGSTEQLATIRMYGPIDSWGGFWGISTKDIGEVLDALPESVTQIILRINSPGGEVYEAVSILNMLRAHRARVTAVVDGLAASAASVIAAACDELVMSPATQLMIHSPSWISFGNARDFRKDADYLDKLEASVVEIYTAKAGEKDWAALLEAETWLTADETVELGLADRKAVVPDAGEAATVGVDDEITVITIDYPLEDDAEDSTTRVVHLRGTAAAAALHNLPSSSEPGDPNRKENAVAYSDLTDGLRARLGVPDAEASDETLLAALDQVLAEQAEDTPAAPAASTKLPEGAVVMDAAALAELRANAELGAQARREQESNRRDGIINAALADGRIATASKDGWRAQLDKDEDGIKEILGNMPKSSAVPVAEIGTSDTLTSADAALYGTIYGSKKEA